MGDFVQVKNLSKIFQGFEAVKNLSFSVRKGEVLGFLGPNGAGKTTTMRMATGYLPPTAGGVFICGKDVWQDTIAAQKHIGYLPEGGPLYNDMTPVAFLKFISEIRGMGENQFLERLEYVVDTLNIGDVLYQTIETLSKGYKRRVALAQAILHDPDVLILDEPTDGLDPNQKHEVRTLIRSMSKDKAIIISTHILEEVQAVCGRAIIIARGQIVASGTPEELAKNSPGHNAVVVKLKSPVVDRVLSSILKIKDVDKVNMNGKSGLIVCPKKGRPILKEVGEAIRKKKVVVEEIYQKTGQLDESFRHLTIDSKKNKG